MTESKSSDLIAGSTSVEARSQASRFIYETIIVGGGISGLGCARTLQSNGRSRFVLITENVGGRILFSKDGLVSFGPWYAREDYEHVRPFLEISRRVGYFDVTFHKGVSRYHMFGLRFLRHPFQAYRTVRAVARYKKEYLRFKKESVTRSQKDAIESNAYLKKMHETDASIFMREEGIEDFAHDFLGEVLYGTTFLDIAQLSAANMLHFSLPLVSKTYRFAFDRQAATAGLEDKMIFDTVVRVAKKDGVWSVITRSGNEYRAQHLVISTSPEVAKRLLPIHFENKGIGIHMFYVRGRLKRFWREGREEVFPESSKVVAISKESEGAYLLCSHGSRPAFSTYFDSYEVVEEKEWNPAFHLIGKQLFQANAGDGLYFTGDYIYPNIEDSYITGMYAANEISKQF